MTTMLKSCKIAGESILLAEISSAYKKLKLYKFGNKDILYANHTNLTGDELYNSLAAARREITQYCREFEVDKILYIVDMRGSKKNRTITKYLTSRDAKEFSEMFIEKQALILSTILDRTTALAYQMWTRHPSKAVANFRQAKDYILYEK